MKKKDKIETLSKDDLTSKQLDYSIFLPALSSFYGTYVGKQQSDSNYIPPNRIPTNFENGVEGMNWLNDKQGYFTYKWSLYSAGHADLDVNKVAPKEDMIRNRDRKNTFVLGDSGGFQIATGRWEGDWKDPNCSRAKKKREQVLTWMDAYMDRGMILDIPSWIYLNPEAAAASGVTTYQHAVDATNINNKYFMQNRNGNCKFLNVLQGGDHADAEKWYQAMKHWSDPKAHDQPFEGWAMGGQNMCDIHLVLKRIVALRFDGLLEKGKQDWMHFLGTSKLEWALMLTDIQRAVRKYHNENFTISFDCASPFLATANGQIYISTEVEDRKKWTYRMIPSVDNKKYATDNRKFSDAVLSDGVFKVFQDSPISNRLSISDVCKYAKGDLNKIGKEGKTSWDSFSYALQMGHNVWTHIHSVQEANRLYDQGLTPKMLVQENTNRTHFRDVVEAVFATSDRQEAERIIDSYGNHTRNAFWSQIIGTRGNSGQKAWTTGAIVNNLFTFDDHVPYVHCSDDSGLDDAPLDQLEELLGDE